MTTAERFWAKVQKSDDPNGCWLWTAAKLPRGYGVFHVRVLADGRRSKAYAHRWSFERSAGRPVAPGLDVMHTCDNPACVNPSHLREGTRQENVDDMVTKGRQALGAKNGQAKLTDAHVHEIRALYRAGLLQRTIAAQFGISRPYVSELVSGKNWPHLREPA